MIHGTTVTLFERVQTGVDAFNRPIYEESAVCVEDVLVGEPSTNEITTTQDLTGKRAVFVLGIPKGDAHVWQDRRVQFFGRTFRTFGAVIEGIEANVPTRWHKKVMVEACDEEQG